MDIFIHHTAEISSEAKIGKGTKIWNDTQVREDCVIGKNCIIGKGVYIDKGVKIGDNCKIQNYACIYKGTNIGNGVFVGPHVVFANDKNPRAIKKSGQLKSESDWKIGQTKIKYGAAIGAGSIILPNVIIGKFSMIGAGSIVTKNVKDYATVFGNPAVERVVQKNKAKCRKK